MNGQYESSNTIVLANKKHEGSNTPLIRSIIFYSVTNILNMRETSPIMSTKFCVIIRIKVLQGRMRITFFGNICLCI